MHSTAETAANLAAVAKRLGALERTVHLAVLPENVFCLGRSASVRDAARSEAEWLDALAPVFTEFAGTIVFGGVPVSGADGKVLNRCMVCRNGAVTARYDKIHLFRLDPDRPGGIDEARLYAPGKVPGTVEIEGWKTALSICYDLRFPELYRACAPVDLILVPAAFTAMTGTAHWEVLLRARAIENQCFVAGVGQCGNNDETGVPLHGNSMLVDPWGTILARAPANEECVLTVELDAARLHAVRRRLPALANRVLSVPLPAPD
jgi:nitrilase